MKGMREPDLGEEDETGRKCSVYFSEPTHLFTLLKPPNLSEISHSHDIQINCLRI